MKTQLEELISAIVKAVPEIVVSECYLCRVQKSGMDKGKEHLSNHLVHRPVLRDITLEDVLRAVAGNEQFAAHETLISASGCFRDKGKLLAQWSLGLPLSDQSPDTLAFLHSLLVR